MCVGRGRAGSRRRRQRARAPPGEETSALMWLLLAGAARAERPPPDSGVALRGSAGDEVAGLARTQDFVTAGAFARGWERTVGVDARISYELGLAARLAGDTARARAYLDRAVTLDPDYGPAR